MDEMTSIVKELIDAYGEAPGEFVPALEMMAKRAPEKERGYFFLYFGAALQTSSYPRLALAVLNRAMDYFKNSRDSSGESKCSGTMGITYDDLGETGKAIEYYNRSMNIDRKIGNKVGEAKNCQNLGLALDKLKDFKTAIGYYEQALQINKELRDKAGQSPCLLNIGVNYSRLKEYRQAVDYYKQALAIDIEIGDQEGELKNYKNLGVVYENLREYEKSREYLERALKIHIQRGDKTRAREFHEKLCLVYNDAENFKKAIEHAEKALAIDIEKGDQWGMSADYGNIGYNYSQLGEFKKAIEYTEKAIAIDQEIDDTEGLAADYGNLGVAYHGLGKFKEAIKYQEKSITLYKETGNKQEELKCYSDIGHAYLNVSEFRKAIEYLETALELNKDIDDKSLESASYLNLSIAYHELGQDEKSIHCLEQALSIYKATGNRGGEALCFINIGNNYSNSGKYQQAYKHYNQALDICKKIKDKAAEARCYSGLGINYASQGKFTGALESLGSALGIYIEMGDKSGEAYSYFHLGIILKGTGKFKEAIEKYKKALSTSQETGDLLLEKKLNHQMGKLYFKDLNQPGLAYNCFKTAIQLSERMREKIFKEEYKIGFFEKISDAYENMILLCLELHKNDEAYDYLERIKSRALLDLMATTEIKPAAAITPKLTSLLEQEEDCLARLRVMLVPSADQKTTPLEPGKVDAILEKLDNVYSEMEQFDPDYVSLRSGTPLSAEGILSIIASEKSNMVLLEYYSTGEKLFIFVLSSRDKKLYVEEVPISQDMLNRYISEDYWRSVVKHKQYPGVGDSWQALSDYLITPAAKYIKKDDLICFVPYDKIHYLPLHALELEGEPIIKHHPVIYFPSASLIKLCKNKGSKRLNSCAAYGIVFEDEARRIAGLFKVKPYLGRSATREQVIETCANKDILHFSCHGKFDTGDPLSSGIVLYDGAVLTAREIFNLKLNCQLVTLSACETGVNERNPGDELIGLTRAFLYAGAPSVVVSLWSVDAASTQELMLEFFKEIKKGANKAEALRKAQIKVMENKEYSHPYYWAPFILVGDWHNPA